MKKEKLAYFWHVSVSAELIRRHVQRQNFTLVNLTLESKTSVILENKLEGELSSELGIEVRRTFNCVYFQFARPKTMNADDITGNDLR